MEMVLFRTTKSDLKCSVNTISKSYIQQFPGRPDSNPTPKEAETQWTKKKTNQYNWQFGIPPPRKRKIINMHSSSPSAQYICILFLLFLLYRSLFSIFLFFLPISPIPIPIWVDAYHLRKDSNKHTNEST